MRRVERRKYRLPARAIRTCPNGSPPTKRTKHPNPPAQGTESRKTLEQAGFKKYTCTEANGTQATFTSTDGLTGVASGTKLFTFHVNPKNALIYDNGSDWLACISYLTKKPENSTSTAQKEPDSFVEQRQTNNNSTAHISDYDFMVLFLFF